MPSPLDLDQLQTFVAISDTGSFTRAADEVFKTQSAVSMQMRRLEEKIGRPLFEKEGRMNRLTDDGERLLAYARRMLRLNGEAVAAFDDSKLAGHLRIGMPDDYADRFLPEIMARFVRSNPRVELTVICEPTVNLIEQVNRATIDLALITHVPENGYSEIVRREPLLWVTSANHAVHEEPILPLAFGRPTCIFLLELAERVHKTRLDHRAEAGAFFRREAVVLHVGLRIGEVDLGVRHVQVAAPDDGFFPLELFQVGEEVAVPLLAIGKAGEFALRVGHINIHEEEVGELGRQHTTFVVVLGHADALRDFQRAQLREDDGAGVALLLRAVPVRRVVRGPELFDLVGVRLGFLQAQDVGLFVVEVFEKIFAEHGAQAVDVPGNQFHAGEITERTAGKANFLAS